MQEMTIREDFFEGAVSLQKGGDWIEALRYRREEKALHHESFVNCAITPAGVRIRFRTDSKRIGLRVLPLDEPDPRRFDLTLGNDLIETVELPAGAGDVLFSELEAGERTVEIWLSQNRLVRVRALLLDNGAKAEVDPDTRLRWVTYGSSITHCGAAHSPARTWPAVAARAHDLHLTCLGYGGNCQLEPLVAVMIRDLPADFITLKVGINIVGGTLAERTFKTALMGAVRIIREKHPDTPLAVISPIISPPRETTPGSTGMTLCLMREQLEDAVQRLKSVGDPNISYFDGLELFGESLVQDYLPDMLHPNDDGYEVMGHRFADLVLPRLMNATAEYSGKR